MGLKIAYIMSRFPHLPETFIMREMAEMAATGQEIFLYPLIFQNDPVVHPEAAAWIPKAHAEPYISGRIAASNLSMFLKHPLTYSRLVWQIIGENLTNPNFLVRGLLLFPKIVHFARQMQGEGINRVHAHYASHPALAAWVIHELTGIPYSVTVHAHDIYARTSMLKTKMRGAEFIVAISEFNREFLVCVTGDESLRAKIRVIHCGIDPRKYTPCEKPLQKGNPLEIICVGSLKPIKGQRFLVETCRILRERGIPFHCTIVGDGPEMPDVRSRVEAYGLTDLVTLAGSKDEEQVSRMLPLANCYVQPSLAEGLPVAVMEALCCNLPVVATAYAGLAAGGETAGSGIRPEEAAVLTAGLSEIYRDTPKAAETALALSQRVTCQAGIFEIITPGVTGLLARPADPESLADALAALYHDPDHARTMALAGQTRVLQSFDLHQNAAQLSGLFSGD
jgi:colanic acid/amylovoran biosynthesis glycosyltransferase